MNTIAARWIGRGLGIGYHIYGATPRTAGFNTVDECAQFFNPHDPFLMWIGASASTGGGITSVLCYRYT
jgi:Trk-type K+ transport system membrane component